MLSQETLTALLAFRRDRAWQQFHSPLNLVVAISVEAGELLELFQWSLPDERRPRPDQRIAVEHEVADLVILLSYLASDLGIDIETAVQDKLAINAERYPVDRSRGNAKKYDEL